MLVQGIISSESVLMVDAYQGKYLKHQILATRAGCQRIVLR